jgi:predicted RNA-binding Zn ribbon-like protein
LLVVSKQQQAPGDLERVRMFVNTADLEEGGEQLTTYAALAEWLVGHGLASEGLRATRGDLRRAVALREGLRAILLAHNLGQPPEADAVGTLEDAARRARLRLRFDELGGPLLEPEAPGVAGALGRLVAIVHASIAEGIWERLKVCREHTCEWAFYDHTKNRSGTWCNMQVCGNRAKARAFRERQAASSR